MYHVIQCNYKKGELND